MPRTKVSKSKRTRDAIAKDEKQRNLEKSLDDFQSDLDLKGSRAITDIEYILEVIKSETTDPVLNMRFVDFLHLNLSQFRDYKAYMTESNKTRSEKRQDDGYITEESGNSASSSAFTAVLSMTQRGRTPGPLSSALARKNSRRSRSAATDRSVLAPKQPQAASNTSSSHTSRSKLRTPMVSRPKAVSADRSVLSKKANQDPQSPQSAFLRWPKPGEFIMSVHGTPLNAPVAPPRSANVNIPTKDGVLSLRPKKLENIDPNLVDNMDSETLKEITTLYKNLEMIVKMSTTKK